VHHIAVANSGAQYVPRQRTLPQSASDPRKILNIHPLHFPLFARAWRFRIECQYLHLKPALNQAFVKRMNLPGWSAEVELGIIVGCYLKYPQVREIGWFSMRLLAFKDEGLGARQNLEWRRLTLPAWSLCMSGS
jgi:hypothetical protein